MPGKAPAEWFQDVWTRTFPEPSNALPARSDAETSTLPPSGPLKAYPKKALASTSERPDENATLCRSFPVKAPYPMLAADERSARVRAQP